MVHANLRPVVRSTDNKVDHRLLGLGVLLPCAIMDTLNEHAVGHGQTVMITEVQYQNNTRVYVREVVPLYHTPPGVTFNVHMDVEVSQNNYGVPS